MVALGKVRGNLMIDLAIDQRETSRSRRASRGGVREMRLCRGVRAPAKKRVESSRGARPELNREGGRHARCEAQSPSAIWWNDAGDASPLCDAIGAFEPSRWIGSSEPSGDDDRRHGGLAILCVGRCAGGPSIVEVIADPAASENLGGHQLRMHVSLLITQEKLVRAVGLRPELGVRNSDGQARSAGRAAENEGINAFSSDHARVWQQPRKFFDNGAFEGATEGGPASSMATRTKKREVWNA